MKRFTNLAILLIIFCLSGCQTKPEEVKMISQVDGSSVNCYLLYGEKSGEAAIIDVGGPIDSLVSFIKENNLSLRYFLFTHGHVDHVLGLPLIKDQFPGAKVVLTKKDFTDLQTQVDWLKNNMGEDWVKRVNENPATRPMLEFEVSSFGTPDIFPEESLELPLGNNKIRVLLTPGHSAGSVSYYIDNKLFTGDLLGYRDVGGYKVQNGSREEVISSVQRLYREIPDETLILPGHGEWSDLGSEKRENPRISAEKVEFE